LKNENFIPPTTHSKIRRLAIFGILAAASVILGKFLQIPIGDTIRISLENLPIVFAGIVFGPVSGMIVGIVADLVGCVARGYEINLIITAGAALIGMLSGIFGSMKIDGQKKSFLQILLPTALAHIVGSMMVKSVGLHVFYSTPWSFLLTTRIPIYFVNIAAESLIVYVLLKNKGIRHSLKDFLK
jgi:ECF transporter S component (folate family)